MGSKLESIRKSLEAKIGSKIRVTTKEGRKKIVVRRGILENTYPNLFVVRFDDDVHETNRISYSYIDVLTHNIELAIYRQTTA